MNMADVLELKLTKADGTIVTNKPPKITAEFLKKLAKEFENELDAKR